MAVLPEWSTRKCNAAARRRLFGWQRGPLVVIPDQHAEQFLEPFFGLSAVAQGEEFAKARMKAVKLFFGFDAAGQRFRQQFFIGNRHVRDPFDCTVHASARFGDVRSCSAKFAESFFGVLFAQTYAASSMATVSRLPSAARAASSWSSRESWARSSRRSIWGRWQLSRRANSALTIFCARALPDRGRF